MMRRVNIRLGSLLLCLTLFAAEAPAAPLTGGTGPGGFDLTNGSTTLKAWLDASDASTRFQDNGITPAGNGNPVYLWKDKSGNNNNATATDTTISRPSYNATALSGNSAIRFDPTGGVGGGADGMKINTALNIATQPYSVFIVDQYYAAIQGRTLQSATGGRNWLIGKWNGLNGNYSEGWVTDPSAVNSAGTNNPTIGVERVGTVANSTSYFINGVDKTASSAPNAPPGTFGLGAGGTYGGEYSQADVSEIIIYTRQLNTAERQIVENYLSAKYNVGSTLVGAGNHTLGANDLYAGDLNTNGNYDYDVVGVGNSGSGTSLSAGAAGFGIEVAAGVGTSLAGPGEYLMAGHNSTPNSIVPVESLNPLVYGDRWATTWYLDKTGSLDATIAFNFNDAGLTLPTPGSSFQLLYSADSNFSDGWQILATTNSISSGTVTFNLANGFLLDGYYTLGINIQVPEPSSLLLLGFGAICLARRSQRRRRLSSKE